jgi:hypothetical protein
VSSRTCCALVAVALSRESKGGGVEDIVMESAFGEATLRGAVGSFETGGLRMRSSGGYSVVVETILCLLCYLHDHVFC